MQAWPGPKKSPNQPLRELCASVLKKIPIFSSFLEVQVLQIPLNRRGPPQGLDISRGKWTGFPHKMD
jgi:hypothetical protein